MISRTLNEAIGIKLQFAIVHINQALVELLKGLLATSGMLVPRSCFDNVSMNANDDPKFAAL